MSRRGVDQRGASLAQYVLMVSLLSVGVIVSLIQYSNAFRKLWCEQVMKVSFAETAAANSMTLEWETRVTEAPPFCRRRGMNAEGEGSTTEVLF